MWYFPPMSRNDDAFPQRPMTLAVGDRGRIVLPASMRRRLGVGAGDELVLELEDSDTSIRLTPRRVLAERDRGAFARLRGPESAVEELLRDRRLEVAREEAVDDGGA